MPMAVVMDFGRSVTYSSCERRKARLSASTLHSVVSTPERIPARMALQLLRSSANFS